MGDRSSEDLHRRVARYYGDGAEAYRRLWAPVLLPMSIELLEAVGVERARRVLDVGTGAGTLLPEIHLRAPAAFVAGVDLSEDMLALAAPSAIVAAMDGARLAFRPECFDVVVTTFVLRHFPQPADVLWEARRVLRAGGRIGIATWGRDQGCRAFDIVQEELESHGAPQAEPLTFNRELLDDEDDLRGLLEEAGFWAVRTWASRLENRVEAEDFLSCRTQLADRQRFEALPVDVRESCLARTRDRLGRLPPDELVDRDEVLFATGLKAR